jgi:hypothetical protein
MGERPPMADDPLQKQPGRGPGRPFVKGKSGNPAGRPRGSRNATTVLCEQLIDGEAEDLVRKLVALGKAGNIPALRLIVERLLPPRRERIELDLPQGRSIADLADTTAIVLAALANGELTADEAKTFTDVVKLQQDLYATAELEPRLAQVEAAAAEWKRLKQGGQS